MAEITVSASSATLAFIPRWLKSKVRGRRDRVSESAEQMVEQQSPVFLFTNNLEQQHVEDELAIDIKERIQDCGDGLSSPDCCIYRVPIVLRHLKEKAYTPKVVSIGPFHYRNERLQDMERHKKIFFKRFAQRAMSSLDDLVRCVKHLEPKVRASYSETLNFSEEELVKLILMDAGFIIELFIMAYKRDHGNDAILTQLWLVSSISQDLCLLENQLPFFVIEELFNRAFPDERRGNLPSFRKLTYKYFEHYHGTKVMPNIDVKVKHFTDLLRSLYLQGEMSAQQLISVDGSHRLLYNANALQEAGIKLKASESKCLLDMKFSGHILEIPQFLVDDNTELVFRNMIALEECHYPCAAYITDYALVLDCLIDTQKDVDLLIHKKIVSNHVGGTNNVALLFNGLLGNVNQLTFNSKYFDICQKLNAYCQDPWHELWATLRHDYCRTPWQTVASIAAIILIFLTVVQTIISILQVVK
ncbi:UPF0481 protein At3g47200-like [Neltuma alba]|uniref:UPF0481 protein At3g47200-like n=1 Tax=Neltuma alba TaxID=207710 RepID=UPI0010A32259|nr:UPF0481 protein At3g47200-like [Prosopis alba]